MMPVSITVQRYTFSVVAQSTVIHSKQMVNGRFHRLGSFITWLIGHLLLSSAAFVGLWSYQLHKFATEMLLQQPTIAEIGAVIDSDNQQNFFLQTPATTATTATPSTPGMGKISKQLATLSLSLYMHMYI